MFSETIKYSLLTWYYNKLIKSKKNNYYIIIKLENKPKRISYRKSMYNTLLQISENIFQNSSSGWVIQGKSKNKYYNSKTGFCSKNNKENYIKLYSNIS